MGTTLSPSAPRSQTVTENTPEGARSAIPGPTRLALVSFILLSGLGLGAALVAGAVLLFNILVFTLFTVLWIAFAAALLVNPTALDELWHALRRRHMVIQLAVWLLFLPVVIGLWIWARPWALPLRVVLALAIGVWNVFLFFPRSA